MSDVNELNIEKDHIKKVNSLSESSVINTPWKILTADCDENIISQIRSALYNFEFKERKIRLFEANSYKKAKRILSKHKDIALIFLDSELKIKNNSLGFIDFIRDELKNNLMHIILSVKNANFEFDNKIFANYRVNFVQTKSEFVKNKIQIITGSVLNSYISLKTINDHNKNLEMIIKERTNELDKKAEPTQNEILSIIANDLKNPFNSLLGFSKLIKEKYEIYDTNKIKAFADVIYQTSDNTFKLFSNIPDWPGIQSGKIICCMKKTSINNLIINNIISFQNQADKKLIALNSLIIDDLNVYCDPNMINSVLRNIISNGIKFTEKGQLFVTAEKKNQECIIIIRDTGIGISPEKLQYLFSADYIHSSESSESREKWGGLNLCKEFINMNMGKITVESAENTGSCFTVSLPLYNESLHK